MNAGGSPSSMPMPEIYAAVAARRTQFDNLLWQVPVLTITAQAFLLAISLGADTRPTARIISCLLSLLVTFLTLNLFARHRQAEVTDAAWLEEYEKRQYGAGQAHGLVWQKIRNETSPDERWFRPFARLPGFRTWAVGLSILGLAAFVILAIAVFWPHLLEKAPG